MSQEKPERKVILPLAPLEAIKAIHRFGLVEENIRHGFPVLNAQQPSEDIDKFIQNLAEGNLELLQTVEMKRPMAPKGSLYTVMPLYYIFATPKLVNQHGGYVTPQYTGDVIAREITGASAVTSPLLILPSETMTTLVQESSNQQLSDKLQA